MGRERRMGVPIARLPVPFALGFLHFVAFPSRGKEAAPTVAPTQRTNDKEPKMITAFFIFVTTAFFAAVVANVAETVTSTRAFA